MFTLGSYKCLRNLIKKNVKIRKSLALVNASIGKPYLLLGLNYS